MHPLDMSRVRELAHQLWPDEPLYDFQGEHVFVWERDNGSLAGFASVSVRPWVDGSESEPCPHVEAWFVEADLRRRGVGRALILAIEDWCRERGFTELTSDTGLDNDVSLRAHSAIGFNPTERIQYFQKSLPADRSVQPGHRQAIAIESFHGSRSPLLTLFALADDSPLEVNRYFELGEVLVARRADQIVGLVQWIATGADWEIKSVAVIEEQQRQGIGATLVRAALNQAFTAAPDSRVLVATATADIGNLRFYQRLGFRMDSVKRDAFDIDRGYPSLEVDGIPVRDQVLFSIKSSELSTLS